ncbi:hypothetical protein J2X12_002838 [Pseudarthrobacter oxydans]|uniref:HNH nuclease domain-containing protein n=1 Tax=Pseudarthrobacter oxydans TaxID=1671 RepID=A0AAW8NEP3_PSEOX|nr:HNH endonuclease signature motif containing protein [Pseudarthrobacter oxydans]MDR6794827.1 hypothetical protein [Pseudarthrobacter oxydans]MDR7164800.1 hypothetical protein [Pseudarthrobacter oxydans]
MKKDLPCIIEGCDRLRAGKGLCKMHHSRLRRSGSTDDPVRRVRPEADRYWEKVGKADGCWNWLGATHGDDPGGGYGVFFLTSSGFMQAHRYAWQMLNGTIPEGMVIDHTCHNRICVKPEHLRLATLSQNAQNLRPGARRSKTGVRGVVQRKNGRFGTRVTHFGVIHSAGTFDTLAQAEAAVIELRNKIFTHNDADRRQVA